MLRKFAVYLSLPLALLGCTPSSPEALYCIVPQPNSMCVTVDQSVKFSSIRPATPDTTISAIIRLCATQFDLPPDGNGQPITIAVDKTLGHPERYKIHSSDSGVTITAGGYPGVFYALNTINQLESKNRLPFVDIDDTPTYAWRGMMIDISRHFFNPEQLREVIDMLAYHKINRLHLHLSDDIGWRVAIDNYPLLTSKGAWRIDKYPEAPWADYTFADRDTEGATGGYLTQDDVRYLVAYAAERFIEVIPEVDVPGHSRAAVACYPELGCNQASSVLCPSNERTYEFLFNVIDELAALFPSEYIHIGGDEVEHGDWEGCARCRAFKRQHKMKDNHALQAYFLKRVAAHVDSLGKTLIGWDDMAADDAPSDAVIMSWTGLESGQKAAEKGHSVIMCPLDYTYLDHYQSPLPGEPQAWGGLNDIHRVYDFPVTPPGLNAKLRGQIMGGQGNLWTENIADYSHLQYMLLPRLAAVAEALWTRPEHKHFEGFAAKLPILLRRYADQGWGYSTSGFTPQVRAQYFDSTGDLVVKLAADVPLYPIHYTLDNTEPTADSPLYDTAVVVASSAVLRAASFKDDVRMGDVWRMNGLKHKATGCKVTYQTPYNEAYSGGGAAALTNNRFAVKRGDHPSWQGFEGADVNLTIDLGSVQTVTVLTMRLFQHLGLTSVMLPRSLKVELSTDGRKYHEVNSTPIPAQRNFDALIKETILSIGPTKARYVRVKAENPGILPPWHPRHGGPSWIFTDEIVIN